MIIFRFELCEHIFSLVHSVLKCSTKLQINNLIMFRRSLRLEQ